MTFHHHLVIVHEAILPHWKSPVKCFSKLNMKHHDKHDKKHKENDQGEALSSRMSKHVYQEVQYVVYKLFELFIKIFHNITPLLS